MNLEKIEKQLYSDKFLDEKNNYIYASLSNKIGGLIGSVSIIYKSEDIFTEGKRNHLPLFYSKNLKIGIISLFVMHVYCMYIDRCNYCTHFPEQLSNQYKRY